jgi:PAS domain S-box-containing protein
VSETDAKPALPPGRRRGQRDDVPPLAETVETGHVARRAVRRAGAADAAPTAGDGRRNARASLRLLLPAVVLLPLAIQGMGAWIAWNAAWEQARAEVAHTADAAAEYARSILELHRQRAERANQVLRGLTDAEIRVNEPALHRQLRDMLHRNGSGDAVRLYVFGQDARVVVNTDFAVSPAGAFGDRDYIRQLRGPDAPAVLLGEVALGRANNRLFFPVTVRREETGGPGAPDGFQGAINVSVSPESVSDGLARLRGNAADVLSIVREDGSVLARTKPVAAPPPWRQAPGAEVMARMAAAEPRFLRLGQSPLDGQARLVGYRRIDGWPAYAAAARDRATIVAHWRERVTGLLAFGMPATFALAILALLVRRAWRAAELGREGLEERVRQRTAELARRSAELSRSEERLRMALDAADLGTWEVDVRTGRMTRAARTATIIGYPAEATEATFDDWRDRLHPEDRAQTVAAFDALRRGQVDRFAAQYRTRRPDGRWAWVESHAQAVEFDAQGLPLRIAGTLQDVTARREAEDRRTLLAREVDHRAKNALAVVQAALRLTPRADPDSYATAVEGRVSALARAHTLLAEQRWAGAELRQILEGELSAFLPRLAAAGQPQAELAGPPMQVAASAAQSLSLAVHELATNAVKYGALAAPGGRLRVTWTTDDTDELLLLAWREAGGPAIGAAPERRGFGSRVVAATVRDQLGGTLQQRWLPAGLEVEMRIPLARIRAGAAPPAELEPMV